MAVQTGEAASDLREHMFSEAHRAIKALYDKKFIRPETYDTLRFALRQDKDNKDSGNKSPANAASKLKSIVTASKPPANGASQPAASGESKPTFKDKFIRSVLRRDKTNNGDSTPPIDPSMPTPQVDHQPAGPGVSKVPSQPTTPQPGNAPLPQPADKLRSQRISGASISTNQLQAFLNNTAFQPGAMPRQSSATSSEASQPGRAHSQALYGHGDAAPAAGDAHGAYQQEQSYGYPDHQQGAEPYPEGSSHGQALPYHQDGYHADGDQAAAADGQYYQDDGQYYYADGQYYQADGGQAAADDQYYQDDGRYYYADGQYYDDQDASHQNDNSTGGLDNTQHAPQPTAANTHSLQSSFTRSEGSRRSTTDVSRDLGGFAWAVGWGGRT